ncbi:MAG: hypothetical protein SGILL_000923 [Bacillariaceae sp.]
MLESLRTAYLSVSTMKHQSIVTSGLIVASVLFSFQRASLVDAFLVSKAAFASHVGREQCHLRTLQLHAVSLPRPDDVNFAPQEEDRSSRIMSRLKSRLKDTKTRLKEKYHEQKNHIKNNVSQQPQAQKPRCMPEQVVNIHDYKEKVANEKNQMVVVRFHSAYCKACQASQRPFRKLTRDYADRIKFVECPVTAENEFLHRGLGVPSLPYGHIYHPDAGLVEEVSINKKVFKDFERIMQYYVDGKGEVEYTEDGEACLPAEAAKRPRVTP